MNPMIYDDSPDECEDWRKDEEYYEFYKDDEYYKNRDENNHDE